MHDAGGESLPLLTRVGCVEAGVAYCSATANCRLGDCKYRSLCYLSELREKTSRRFNPIRGIKGVETRVLYIVVDCGALRGEIYLLDLVILTRS
jgi:hypothetical protein